MSPFALDTTGGHGASTATVYFLFTKQLRDSGVPADVLVGKLKKDFSFSLRRGKIAYVTTHALDAAQRAVEDDSSSTRRAGVARQPPPLPPPFYDDDALIHSYLLCFSSFLPP